MSKNAESEIELKNILSFKHTDTARITAAMLLINFVEISPTGVAKGFGGFAFVLYCARTRVIEREREAYVVVWNYYGKTIKGRNYPLFFILQQRIPTDKFPSTRVRHSIKYS